jgi:trans-aconitate methyltransferase
MNEAVGDYFSEPSRYLGHEYYLRARGRALRDLVSDARGRRILDAGCGDGRMSLMISRPGDSLTLLDSSEAMLAKAKTSFSELNETSHPSVEFIVGDIEAHRPRNDYDLVLGLGLLAHSADPMRTLEHLMDLTVRGGALIVQITDGETALGTFLIAYDRLKETLWRARGYSLSRIDRSRIVARCEMRGFRLRAEKRYGVDLPGLRQVLPAAAMDKLQELCYRSAFLNGWTSDRMFVFQRDG